MKTLVLAAAAAAALAGANPARATTPAGDEPSNRNVLAEADALRARVANFRAEVSRISRDPTIPEERRSAEIEALAGQVQSDSDALASLVDADMAARKAEARRALDAAEAARARASGSAR